MNLTEIAGDSAVPNPAKPAITLTLPSDTRLGLIDVLNDVIVERRAQDAQWGGPDHDADHCYSDWCAFILKQVGKALQPQNGRESWEEAMTKVAALAIAALEASQHWDWEEENSEDDGDDHQSGGGVQ